MAAFVVAYAAMTFFSLMWFPHEEVAKHFGLLIVLAIVGIGFLLNPAVPVDYSRAVKKTATLGLLGVLSVFGSAMLSLKHDNWEGAVFDSIIFVLIVSLAISPLVAKHLTNRSRNGTR